MFFVNIHMSINKHIMKKNTPKMNESEQESFFATQDKWKLFKWLWDELDTCPYVVGVEDADA